MKKLLIVESPTKAKTIGKYLPKDDHYIVKASVGHIRDLPKSNKKAIDIANGFVPHYEISAGKEQVVAELAQAAAQADAILLATDPDREGEAIAWHLAEALHLGAQAPVHRITFHEITQNAIQKALKEPRAIDQNLRKAQEARRVLDRLVGYDLSGLIWKKVRYGLSAGRVQSPALRILAEREREIRAHVSDLIITITGTFITAQKAHIRATHAMELCAADHAVQCRATAETIRIAAQKTQWHIDTVKQTPTRRAPYAPFTTSTLQQVASSRLGFAPSRTMRAAQKLYEAGHITYMRTDSVAISKDVLPHIFAAIRKAYGDDACVPRTYTTKSKNAQEAHEAIRPSSITVEQCGATEDERKLYALIRTRTLAAFMPDAELLRTKIMIAPADTQVPALSATGSVVVVPGWLHCDPVARGDDVDLPVVTQGECVTLATCDTEEKWTEPPKRYTEAGLVKELEKRGIGRPSTYATIIKTIQDRGYVEREGRSLLVTDTGMVVSGFLEKHFPTYVSDSFTAEMEDELDDIANGTRDYAKTLEALYTPFAKAVHEKETIEKVTTLGDADPAMRCPLCNEPMIIKLGRSGTFLSCKRFPACDGARTMDGTVMEGPKEIGELCPMCGKPLVERTGRSGTFIACSTYPKCTYVKKDPAEEARRDTGVTCPACKKGTMMERKGRFGIFYSCSQYPACKNAIKARPTGDLCTFCGALMMEGTKTIPTRCSDKTCPNHNPHKISVAHKEKKPRTTKTSESRKFS